MRTRRKVDTLGHTLAVGTCCTAFLSCAGGSHPARVETSQVSGTSEPAQAVASSWTSALCSEAPIRLETAPDEPQTRGCVVKYQQAVADPAYEARFGIDVVERRYILYAPTALPSDPAPVVLVFPGYTASAEAAAVYYTHTRFEALADEHGFLVVYGNGLPFPPDVDDGAGLQEQGGYLQGCLLPHTGEGIDVRYVREILDQLGAEYAIDRSRIYATGLSAGGGMAFQLALEAPDLVAAIAPVAALPFQPRGTWLHHCNVAPGHDQVSIAMLAATADPFVAYEPGPSQRYPESRYPGMEATRDVWLEALGISGEPLVTTLPDRVSGDSHEAHSGVTNSSIERFDYPAGPAGQHFVYYRAEGMGHWWPNPAQIWQGLWDTFGKTNQDIDFADEAWRFFSQHSKAAR